MKQLLFFNELGALSIRELTAEMFRLQQIKKMETLRVPIIRLRFQLKSSIIYRYTNVVSFHTLGNGCIPLSSSIVNTSNN